MPHSSVGRSKSNASYLLCFSTVSEADMVEWQKRPVIPTNINPSFFSFLLKAAGWQSVKMAFDMMMKKCCYGREKNFGSICSSPFSISNSPLTHNQHQPFQIKCERYIFIKKCVRSFIEVCILCWLCFRI